VRPLAMTLSLAFIGWNALAEVIPTPPVPVPEPGFYPEFGLALVGLIVFMARCCHAHFPK
jgi:hypothetical protein